MNRLIIIGGYPGSGKTTIGRQLAKRIGATYLDKDNYLYHNGAVTKEDDLLAYYHIVEDAKRLLKYSDVVLVAPYIKQRLTPVRGLDSGNVIFVDFDISIELNEFRVKERNLLRDKSKLEDFDSYYNSIILLKPIFKNYINIKVDIYTSEELVENLHRRLLKQNIKHNKGDISRGKNIYSFR